MHDVTINGASLACAEYGRGAPLALVHGSASDHRTWQQQQAVFAKHYRVINYSRRYHWPNEPIPEDADYAMAQHVDDLVALLTDCEAAPAHLVGHSYGAFLCILAAIQAPHLVRTLVLAEPPVVTLFISNTPKPLEILKLLATRPRTALAVISFGAKAVGPATAAAQRGETPKAMRLFGRTILGQRFFDRLSGERLAQVDANAFKAEFLGSGFAPLDENEVRKVKAPTLLITAAYSHAVFHRLTDRLAQLLDHNMHIEIPDASHMMHEDNAQAFNRAVLSFLGKHDRSV